MPDSNFFDLLMSLGTIIPHLIKRYARNHLHHVVVHVVVFQSIQVFIMHERGILLKLLLSLSLATVTQNKIMKLSFPLFALSFRLTSGVTAVPTTGLSFNLKTTPTTGPTSGVTAVPTIGPSYNLKTTPTTGPTSGVTAVPTIGPSYNF
jgi:hypothetical protein